MTTKSNPTGSVAQDALRLGFQKTCSNGLEILLKVNDKTTEACQAFLERHREHVEDVLSDKNSRLYKELDETEAAYHQDYYPSVQRRIFDFPEWYNLITWVKLLIYRQRLKRQNKRQFELQVNAVEAPTLDVERGHWTSKIRYTLIAHKWCGWKNREKVCEPEVRNDYTYIVITKARKSHLYFTSYDEYTEWLPDEATNAAYEAKQIGLEKLQVVTTVIGNAVDPDPIIVGYVGNEMFLIAWVGYDIKDPLSCNI